MKNVDPREEDEAWQALPVVFPASIRILRVECGTSHSVALTTEGRVFSWGLYRDKGGPLGYKAKGEPDPSQASQTRMCLQEPLCVHCVGAGCATTAG